MMLSSYARRWPYVRLVCSIGHAVGNAYYYGVCIDVTKQRENTFVYNRAQRFLFLGLTWRAALVASSKTSLTPSLVLAEHSRYP